MMNRKLLGWLVAGCVLFASACSRDEVSEDPNTSADLVTVSFTLSPEGKTALTRAVHYPDSDSGEWPQISDGSKALTLIYAVYNSNYELLEQYGDNDSNPSEPHYGQVVIDKVDEFPVTIDLRLIRTQQYHIAFWAQDPACEAYDTNDLTMVEVLYKDKAGKNFKNNDETRDAFCKVESLTVTGDESNREVILYRPLSQINLGTAGYDFEANNDFLYSKIVAEGAAKYFDVVRNIVITENDVKANPEVYAKLDGKPLTETVTYDYARIPAYLNYEGSSLGKYPAADIPAQNDGEAYEAYFRRFQEQFLRVQLYDDVDRTQTPYLPYLSSVPGSGETRTETFKYLSMCYVLVSDYVDQKGHSYGTTLPSVTIYVAERENGAGEAMIGRTGASATVTTVPVQRNWRTNIFGDKILDFRFDYTPKIKLAPTFDGEYNNGSGQDGSENWDSQKPATGGYPDEKSDASQE